MKQSLIVRLGYSYKSDIKLTQLSRLFHYSCCSVMVTKPKIAAILVIGLLTASIVGTGIAAVTQAIADEHGTSSLALGSFANQNGETNRGEDGVKGAFFRVCPFH